MRILSTSSKRLIGATLLLAALPMPILALSNTTDPEYRACMQQALSEHAGTVFPAVQAYNRAWETAMQERDRRKMDAWNSERADDARDEMREADKAFRETTRDARNTYRDAERDANRTYRDAERGCKDAFRDREDRRRDEEREREREERNRERDGVSMRDRCLSSSQCGSGKICTTERGDCRSACEPGAEVCTAVCAGVCVTA